MNYKLAKKLKDAGYLQRFCSSYLYPENWELIYGSEDIGKFAYDSISGNVIPEEHYHAQKAYEPNLSELIKKCGKEFGGLNYYQGTTPLVGGKSPLWGAYSFVSIYDGKHIGISTEGETPEVAVAELWLALNKK